MDGSGALESMNLDAWQARGETCAHCQQGTGHGRTLHRIGKLVGSGDDIVVCPEHRNK